MDWDSKFVMRSYLYVYIRLRFKVCKQIVQNTFMDKKKTGGGGWGEGQRTHLENRFLLLGNEQTVGVQKQWRKWKVKKKSLGWFGEGVALGLQPGDVVWPDEQQRAISPPDKLSFLTFLCFFSLSFSFLFNPFQYLYCFFLYIVCFFSISFPPLFLYSNSPWGDPMLWQDIKIQVLTNCTITVCSLGSRKNLLPKLARCFRLLLANSFMCTCCVFSPGFFFFFGGGGGGGFCLFLFFSFFFFFFFFFLKHWQSSLFQPFFVNRYF